jgi:hypothetical protein
MIRKLHLAKLAAATTGRRSNRTKPETAHSPGTQAPVPRHMHLATGALPHLMGHRHPDARIPLRRRHGRGQRARHEPGPATYQAHTQPMLSHINVGTAKTSPSANWPKLLPCRRLPRPYRIRPQPTGRHAKKADGYLAPARPGLSSQGEPDRRAGQGLYRLPDQKTCGGGKVDGQCINDR